MLQLICMFLYNTLSLSLPNQFTFLVHQMKFTLFNFSLAQQKLRQFSFSASNLVHFFLSSVLLIAECIVQKCSYTDPQICASPSCTFLQNQKYRQRFFFFFFFLLMALTGPRSVAIRRLHPNKRAGHNLILSPKRDLVQTGTYK